MKTFNCMIRTIHITRKEHKFISVFLIIFFKDGKIWSFGWFQKAKMSEFESIGDIVKILMIMSKFG